MRISNIRTVLLVLTHRLISENTRRKRYNQYYHDYNYLFNNYPLVYALIIKEKQCPWVVQVTLLLKNILRLTITATLDFRVSAIPQVDVLVRKWALMLIDPIN